MEQWVHKNMGDDLFDFIKGEQINGELLLFSGQYPMYNGGIEPSGYLDTYNTKAPQIIMSEGGNSCGFINFITDDFWRGGHCYLVKLKKEELSDKNFFYYLLKYHEENIMKLRVGSGLPNIQKKDLYKYPISYPADLSAQRRIAAILTSADKVIAATQKTIAKYKQIKQGMMEELLKPKEGWKMVKLGECCEDIFSGKNTTRQDFGKYVVYGSTGPIGYSEDYEYDFDAALVARVGANAGLVNKVSGLYDVSDNTLIIKILKNIDLNYLYYLLMHLNLNQFIFGSGQPLVTAGLLKKIEIPIPYKNGKPDLVEQRRIAAILSGIDAKIAAEEKVLEKYEKVKKGLMERLMKTDL